MKQGLNLTHPELLKEWDYQLNKDLDPGKISYGSVKKIWWRCSSNHSWQATPNDRSGGNGCPYCAGRLPIVGKTDLNTVRPDLAAEWNCEKNTIMPTGVLPQSNRKVWWICPKGHEYEAKILNRYHGSNCPYCSGRSVIVGETDLCTTDPEVASQWNTERNGELKPISVSRGSNKKVWWICEKGHEWQATVEGRTNGNGCPYCSGRYVIKGENDFATLAPALVKEWDYSKNINLEPCDFSLFSNKKMWWKCSQGHEWKTSIGTRSRGAGCPYCNRKRVLKGETDAASLYPELLSEWDTRNNSLALSDYAPSSNERVWWKCQNGHSWQTSISIRCRGSGCPYCHKKIPLIGENDLQTVNPELTKEWDQTRNGELTPSKVLPTSNRKVWWRCKNGHQWEATVYNRYRNHTGCPYCMGREIIKGFNDLASRFPAVAKEWDFDRNDTSPDSVHAFSTRRVWWKCIDGHGWQSMISNRSAGYNCPYCTGKRVIPGKTDLASTRPDLISEWDYERNTLKPTEVSAGSQKRAWWKCKKCATSWHSIIGARNKGSGCPSCNESQGERALREICEKMGILFSAQFIYNDCRYKKPCRFDGSIVKKDGTRCQIEFDGVQHFRPIEGFTSEDDYVECVIRDAIKTNYCEEHGIPLLRIRYDQIDLIELLVEDMIENTELYRILHNPLLSKEEYYEDSALLDGASRQEFLDEFVFP